MGHDHGVKGGDDGPRMGFLKRVLLTFTAPGALGDSLRAHPAWFLAALLGAVMVVGATAAIPTEIWSEFMRAQTLARGGTVQPGMEGSNLFRIFGVVGAGVGWFIILFAFTGIITFIFGFVLGDEGRYRQYLAAFAHANLVGALGAVLITPLRIARRDPQLALSVGTFLEGILENGFLLTWLRTLDLFALWSWVVLAILVSRIDTRRSLGSAVGILLTLVMVLLLGVAWLQVRSLA